MKPKPPPAARKHRAGRWVAAVLVVVALGAHAYGQFRASARQAEARAALLASIDREIKATPVDGSELSRLVVQLQKLPDHETASDLLAAFARIELARDRPERALALFGNRASAPGASPAEQGLGAEILLRVQESGAHDATATGLLRQAVAFAQAAYEASGDPGDLLRAWQAASRLGDDPAAKDVAARLVERHGGSPAARLVQLAASFDPANAAAVAALRTEFARVPVELEAMHVLAVLQSTALEDAAAAAEALLLRGAGVLAARWAAALVFQACALTYAEGSAERGSWVARRDTQLDWLLANSPPGDVRRGTWNDLRNRR